MVSRPQGFVATVLALAGRANIKVAGMRPSAPRAAISRRLRIPMQGSGQPRCSRRHASLPDRCGLTLVCQHPLTTRKRSL